MARAITPLTEILREKGLTQIDLASKLEISLPTMAKRFKDGNWKESQKKTLKKLTFNETY